MNAVRGVFQEQKTAIPTTNNRTRTKRCPTGVKAVCNQIPIGCDQIDSHAFGATRFASAADLLRPEACPARSHRRHRCDSTRNGNGRVGADENRPRSRPMPFAAGCLQHRPTGSSGTAIRRLRQNNGAPAPPRALGNFPCRHTGIRPGHIACRDQLFGLSPDAIGKFRNRVDVMARQKRGRSHALDHDRGFRPMPRSRGRA